MVKIVSVRKGSRAWWRGIRAGDCLEEINGSPIDDVLDYRFRLTAEKAVLGLCRGSKKFTRVIRKPEELLKP